MKRRVRTPLTERSPRGGRASRLVLRCPSCGQATIPDHTFCGWCGVRLAPVSSSAIPKEREEGSGERRQLTVMFCDLVGSTELSGRLDIEDYRALLRSYREVATGALRQFGGYVAGYQGDGLLAYFGWPQTFDDAAERAVRAGLQVVERVRCLSAPESLAVRVGIHTGPVVVARESSGTD